MLCFGSGAVTEQICSRTNCIVSFAEVSLSLLCACVSNIYRALLHHAVVHCLAALCKRAWPWYRGAEMVVKCSNHHAIPPDRSIVCPVNFP